MSSRPEEAYNFITLRAETFAIINYSGIFYDWDRKKMYFAELIFAI